MTTGGEDPKSVPKNTNDIDTKEKDNKKIYTKKRFWEKGLERRRIILSSR